MTSFARLATCFTLLVPVALMLTGCATVPTDGSAQSQVHIGVVRVVTHPGVGQVRQISVRTLGLGWDGAAFLGWRKADYVRANPTDCQLLIVVRRAADMKSVTQILEAMKGEKPCVVNTDFAALQSPSSVP